MPGYLAIVAFKDFDRRFSSAFTSTGMTCILTWMTKSSLDLVAFKFQVNKKAQNHISVYCIVHQLVELVIMTGLFLRVKLLYLLVAVHSPWCICHYVSCRYGYSGTWLSPCWNNRFVNAIFLPVVVLLGGKAISWCTPLSCPLLRLSRHGPWSGLCKKSLYGNPWV